MEQYFAGRTKMCINAIPEYIIKHKKIEDAVFSNERIDEKWNATQYEVYHSTFSKMGFRNSQFKQCNLSFCVFIDCYFKKAIFDQVKFVGCLFINCNFDLAVITKCDFRYASFDNCFIPYSQMKNNFPDNEENIKAKLCRSLSLQCLKLGEINEYKLYLFEEKASNEVHSIRKLIHRGNSFYNKYSLSEGLGGLFDYMCSKVSKIIWGYGEKMSSLLCCMLLVMLTYSCVYYFNEVYIVLEESNGSATSRAVLAIYISLCNFFSFMGNEIFKTQALRFIGLSEYILGVILMGFFVAALFRQINRR